MKRLWLLFACVLAVAAPVGLAVPPPAPAPAGEAPAPPAPEGPAVPLAAEPVAPIAAESGRRKGGGLVVGAIILFLGVVLLAGQFVPGFDVWRLWPLIIVAIGLSIIFRGGNR